MMDKKKLNKILVWIFLGTAIWWAGFFATKSKKWKRLTKKITEDIKLGLKEMKSFFESLKNKYAKKK
jgi:hypothetical protein